MIGLARGTHPARRASSRSRLPRSGRRRCDPACTRASPRRARSEPGLRTPPAARGTPRSRSSPAARRRGRTRPVESSGRARAPRHLCALGTSRSRCARATSQSERNRGPSPSATSTVHASSCLHCHPTSRPFAATARMDGKCGSATESTSFYCECRTTSGQDRRTKDQAIAARREFSTGLASIAGALIGGRRPPGERTTARRGAPNEERILGPEGSKRRKRFWLAPCSSPRWRRHSSSRGPQRPTRRSSSSRGTPSIPRRRTSTIGRTSTTAAALRCRTAQCVSR